MILPQAPLQVRRRCPLPLQAQPWSPLAAAFLKDILKAQRHCEPPRKYKGCHKEHTKKIALTTFERNDNKAKEMTVHADSGEQRALLFTLSVVRGQAGERVLLGGLRHSGVKDGRVHKQATDSPESAVSHGVTT